MLCPACSVILYERVALNKFLRGKSERDQHTYAANGSEGLLYQERAFSYIIKFLMRGDVLMNLMELRLQQVLQENRAEFIDSLRLSGIDVKRGATIKYRCCYRMFPSGC